MTKAEREEKLKLRLTEMTEIEDGFHKSGIRYIGGVDEVGRGPLAGPVYAACVILPADFDVLGIDDSKKLSEKKREELDSVIREKALAYGIGIADNREIDDLNILNATKQAMERAVLQADEMLRSKENAGIELLIIDALRLDSVEIRQESLIKGDSRSLSVAAASIVAKVARDSFMRDMNNKYPGYGFDSNKGYGTATHYEGIRTHGISPIHRTSFLKNLREKHRSLSAYEKKEKGIGKDKPMGKKFYAVKKGRKTGIFNSWDECKAQVEGFEGAVFKSFANLGDAEEFLNPGLPVTAEKISLPRAYVDGSYDVATGRFSCGVLVLDGKGETEISRVFEDEDSSKLRNVAGEIMGARCAVEYAIEKGFKEIEIYHDYLGVGKWADGEWKANLEMTRDYKIFIAESRNKIGIKFVKIKAHSGNRFNERADRLAKQALGIK